MRSAFWALVRIIIGFLLLDYFVPEFILFVNALSIGKCIGVYLILYFMYHRWE